MNYGLYVSASGVLTNLYRQDVYANNLANVDTASFKPDVADLSQRSPEAAEDDLGYELSHRLLDRLGGGVFAGPQRIDFSQGAIQRTGKPLDVALTEPNAFFAIRGVDPQTGQPGVQLTRDGRLTTNDAGELVTPAGHPVLDSQDQSIVLPRGAEARIAPDGSVFAGERLVARLQVARVDDPQQLRKLGENRYALTGTASRQPIERPSLQPGAVEASAVNPITTLMQMIAATKAATGNSQMIRYHDTLMDQAVNRLGRVG